MNTVLRFKKILLLTLFIFLSISNVWGWTITASNTGKGGEVKVSWSEQKKIIGSAEVSAYAYIIYYYKLPSTILDSGPIYSLLSLPYKINGLSNKTNYSFFTRAWFDTANYSDSTVAYAYIQDNSFPSITDLKHTDPDKPDASANADNDILLEFSWSISDSNTDPAGWVRYRYRVATSGTWSGYSSYIYEKGDRSYAFYGENGKSYQLYVEASDDSGNTTTANSPTIVCDTVPPTVAINGPSNANHLTGNQTISYTAADNRAIYKTEISATKGSVSGTTWHTAPDDGSAILTVKVWDEAGWSASDSKSYTLYNPPPAPSNLKVVKAENNAVELSWEISVPADFKEYVISRTDADGTEALLASSNSENNFTDSGLTNGKTYKYKVKTVDTSNNESAFSNVVEATPRDTISPNAPTINPDDQWIGNGWVILVWKAPTQNTDGTSITDLAGYNVYYQLNGASAYVKANSALVSQTAFKKEGLENFKTYNFKVRAVDTSGNESADSAVQEEIPIPHAVVQKVNGISNRNVDIDPLWDSVRIEYFTGMKTDWVRIKIKDQATGQIYYEYVDYDPHISWQNNIDINALPTHIWDVRTSLPEDKGKIVPAGNYRVEVDAGRWDPMPAVSGLSAKSITGAIGDWIEDWNYSLLIKGIKYLDLNLKLWSDLSSTDRLVADGKSAAKIWVEVTDQSGRAVSGIPVKLSVSPGEIGSILDTDPKTVGPQSIVTTGADGKANAVFQAGTQSGMAVVVGRLGVGVGAVTKSTNISLVKIGSFTITPGTDSDSSNDIYNENFYAGLGKRKFTVEVKDESGNPIPGLKLFWKALGAAGNFPAGESSLTDSSGKASNNFQVSGTGTVTVIAGLLNSQTSASTGPLKVIWNNEVTLDRVRNGEALLVSCDGAASQNRSLSIQSVKKVLNQVVPRKMNVTSYTFLDETAGKYDGDTVNAIDAFRDKFGITTTNEKAIFNRLVGMYPDLSSSDRGRVLGKETLVELENKYRRVLEFINGFTAEANRNADDSTQWRDFRENPRLNKESDYPAGVAYMWYGQDLHMSFASKLPNFVPPYYRWYTENHPPYFSPGLTPEQGKRISANYALSNYTGIDCSGLVIECMRSGGKVIADATAAGILNDHSRPVPFGNEKAGDVVAYRNDRNEIIHVAILVSAGSASEIVEASSIRLVVVRGNYRYSDDIGRIILFD